ncbi:hypothetical protein [Ulvibacterium sp.]|uniref:hypothetical protein n=1 Tax=Ulvibacterium sp. TaxID=2665914 RepID=UPI003BA95CD7
MPYKRIWLPYNDIKKLNDKFWGVLRTLQKYRMKAFLLEYCCVTLVFCCENQIINPRLYFIRFFEHLVEVIQERISERSRVDFPEVSGSKFQVPGSGKE